MPKMEYSPKAPLVLYTRLSEKEFITSLAKKLKPCRPGILTEAFFAQSAAPFIIKGKKTAINSRPIRAGLNLFFPIPPHNTLPKITADTAPNTTT